MPASIVRRIAMLAALAAVVAARPSLGAGLSEDARCQKGLAVGMRRLTSAVLKGIERCHRDRMRGELPATVDCNDPASSTGNALARVERAAAKLGTLAARNCDAASAPAALGYDPCPAPGAAPAGTYPEVASCLACVARDRARQVGMAVFGAPVPPGARTDETTCHAAVARGAREYAEARMRAQRQCRTAEERGLLVGFDCRDGDYEGKIGAALLELHSRISTAASCPDASVVALDLCPSASGGIHFKDSTPGIETLRSCIEDAANDGTGDLYDRVYAPGTPSSPADPPTISIDSAWADSGGPSVDERNPRFRLTLGVASTVSIELVSGAADAHLLLLDAGGSVLAEDDNGGGGTNSRISVALGAGRYLLVAGTQSPGARGGFTISTDAGSLEGCFFAYDGPNQTGSPTRFCDGGTGERFTSDTYSSLRVPQGLFVRAYENADGSGGARTYYGDAPSLQLDDAISSIEWGVFDTADFFMVWVSDSQITWGHCSDNPGSALCAEEQAFFGPATEQQVALFYNTNLTNAVNAIRDSTGARAFGGLIVNGDLTEFGKQDHDLEDYIEIYDQGVSANVYPGLGNHDYANNVDDCFANFCASAMVDYFAGQVASLNVASFDYAVEETPLVGTPPVRYDHIGSLGYSWDIGDVHFVQLNNYPTYTRLWEHSLPLSDHWYDIRSSITWLRDDLQTAVDAGREIVLNLHDWGSADVGAFRDVLDDFPVSAVYGGHYHGSFGRYAESGPYTDGKRVPVFLAGSAHYGTMLVGRFTGGKLYVWVLRVDHFDGATLQVREGGVFHDVANLATLFDVCPACTTTYEYVYDFR